MSQSIEDIVTMLNRDTLNKYVIEQLNKNKLEKEAFIKRFAQTSTKDLINKELNSFSSILYNKLDTQEYVRCLYEYWDDTDPFGSFINSLEHTLAASFNLLKEKKYYHEIVEFIKAALSECEKYDMARAIENADNFGGICAADYDINNDAIPQNLFKPIVNRIAEIYNNLTKDDQKDILNFLKDYGEKHNIYESAELLAEKIPDRTFYQKSLDSFIGTLRNAISNNEYYLINYYVNNIHDLLWNKDDTSALDSFMEEFKHTIPVIEIKLNQARTTNSQRKELLEELISLKENNEYYKDLSSNLIELMNVNIDLDLPHEVSKIFTRLCDEYKCINKKAAFYLKKKDRAYINEMQEIIHKNASKEIYYPYECYSENLNLIEFHLLYDEYDKAFDLISQSASLLIKYSSQLPDSFYTPTTDKLIYFAKANATGPTDYQNYVNAVSCLNSIDTSTPENRLKIKDAVNYIRATVKRRKLLMELLDESGF